jgi:hypothetical protein
LRTNVLPTQVSDNAAVPFSETCNNWRYSKHIVDTAVAASQTSVDNKDEAHVRLLTDSIWKKQSVNDREQSFGQNEQA